MALASQGYELAVTLVGAGVKTSTLRYDLTAADWATATTDAATIIAALNGMTDAVVKKYSLGEKFVEDSLSPPAGVDIADRVILRGYIDGSLEKKCQVMVPGISATSGILVAQTGENKNVVDITDPLVTTYWALFDNTGEATLSDGESAGTLLGGSRRTVASDDP